MYESLVASVPPVPPTSADLAMLKAHCRVDSSDPDAALLLPVYLQAARGRANSYLKQTFYETSYTLVRDTLPSRGSPFPTGAPAHAAFWNRVGFPGSLDGFFRIFNPPLISIDSVEYLDTNGHSQTLPPTAYAVTPGFPGRIAPAYGQLWPLSLPQIGAVTIKYTCGYGSTTTTVTIASGTTTTVAVTTGPGFDPPLTTTTTAATVSTDVAGTTVVANVPFAIQAAVLLHAASLYRNREAVTEGALTPLPMGVKDLLDSANRGYHR
jgi:hypothetical protein